GLVRVDRAQRRCDRRSDRRRPRSGPGGRLRALVALMAVVALASSVHASPSPYAWRREILLGANEQEHFYLVESMTNPGNAYVASESLSIYQRSNADPRW